MQTLQRWSKRLVAVILLFVVLAGGYYWLWRDNVHIVIPGEFIRTAQLEPEQLSQVIKKYQIKSVINLRGKAAGEAWYDDERAAVEKQGAEHFDIRLQAHAMPTPQQLRKLVGMLQTAPRPVLIHCKGGADRTGLASALALVLNGDSFQRANQQVSWRFFAFSSDSVGRLVMPYYQCYLQKNQQKSSPKTLLEWVREPEPYRCG